MDPVPPGSRNGFEYYNNDFHVVIPPYNRHRRCTVPEPHDLLCSPGSASVKDKPAHWYRAQLIHYGLRPTDNKGTAVMRLLDAVRLGDLEVPDHLVKLEENLRREWQKNFQRMQKSTERGSTTKTTTKDIDRTRTIFDRTTPKQKAKQSQDLKARTVGPGFAVPALPFSDNKDYYTGANAKPRAQSYETQKRIEGGIKYISASSTSPSKKQDNLRAGYEETRQTCPGPAVSLGLLNGNYKINAHGLNCDSGMSLCLDGTSAWGEFKIGDMEGVFFMPERPWNITRLNNGGRPFEWRGIERRVDCGYYGPKCTGEMRFLGDGNVAGTFYCVIPDDDIGDGELFDCDFSGYRISGKNETRPHRSAWSLREEFLQLGSEYS